MYYSSVVYIIDCGSGIWRYKQYDKVVDNIHFRTIWHFLGVHSKAAFLALQGDMGWTSSKTDQHINKYVSK